MAPSEDFPSCRLPYTLQTSFGMVTADGKPQRRRVPVSWCSLEDTPDPLSQISEKELHRRRRVPDIQSWLSPVNDGYNTHVASTALQRLRGNIKACQNHEVNAAFMKRYMRTKKRIDLEQAAAIVISAVRNEPKLDEDDRATMTKALLQGLEDDLITKSCMWLESFDGPGMSDEESMFTGFAKKLEYLLARKQIFIDTPKDWKSLVAVLQPHLAQPADYLKWRDDGRIGRGVHPSAPRTLDSIANPRKMFRAIQRRINAYFKFWVPDVRLHCAIDQLQDEVLYPTSALLSVADGTEDTMLVAHYFFGFQRRLQLKVVSDINWTRFLAKGEGETVLQNSPTTMTLFEEDRSNFAGQSGVPIGEQDMTALTDKCCLLMEEYVQAFGDGKKESLTFKTWKLRDEAKLKGLPAPGPVHKFLAKDIMSWNDSWADDAFANDKVPGWEIRLAERRSAGVVPGNSFDLVMDRVR